MKIRAIRISIYAVFFLIISMAAYTAEQSANASASNAQEETKAYVPPPAGDKKLEMTVEGGEGTKKIVSLQSEILNQLVTLDFKNADLQNVIRLIAAKTGLNVIMSQKDVKGVVTLHLENVPLRDALENILRVNSLSYVVEPGGLVRIVPRSEITTSKIEFETKAIKISWVKAIELKKSIEPFVKSEGGSVTPDEKSNKIIISAPPPIITKAEKLIEELDVPEKQVLIEARMVDMTDDISRQLGIRWGVSNLDPVTGLPVGQSGSVDLYDPLVATGGFFSWENVEDGRSIFLQLQALEERNQAETLAAPRIVTMNHIGATIELVRKIPYISSSTTEGGVTYNVYEFRDIGSKITITPEITNNGYVKMKINQKHTILIGTPDGKTPPVTDERSANNEVLVKDEDVLVIGGLRQLARVYQTSGVPWLNKAPVLGWLFRDSTPVQKKVELILFVKPSIVKTPSITTKQDIQYNLLDTNWNLPDYFFDDVKIDNTPYKSEAYFEGLETEEGTKDTGGAAE